MTPVYPQGYADRRLAAEALRRAARERGFTLTPLRAETRTELHMAAFLREVGARLGLEPIDAEIILRADVQRRLECPDCGREVECFALTAPCAGCEGSGTVDEAVRPPGCYDLKANPAGWPVHSARCEECDGEGRTLEACVCAYGHDDLDWWDFRDAGAPVGGEVG